MRGCHLPPLLSGKYSGCLDEPHNISNCEVLSLFLLSTAVGQTGVILGAYRIDWLGLPWGGWAEAHPGSML